ncbi:hypothetical protein PYCCODRAFT_1424993 [Trametes coccinea BRFM310]|uniref:Transposase IS30-like HTH domain-containing protein n=1 Tax=Trametes coccinea (strain BRFM310) TaxID=1353009 RepID=A0A1Y2INM2_TRAC3|nr:hypothetical protein PYCCODRAFT_1424993 [Trametes coccinea BRFM310]
MAPAGTTELSPTKRSQIVALRKEGLTYGQIAARLGVARSTCCKTVQRYNTYKTYRSLHRSGRPRALTPIDKHIIIRTIKEHRFWSYKKVGIEAGGYTELQVRRTARQAGYRRRKRVKWARQNLKRDWAQVIWTDETALRLGQIVTHRTHPSPAPHGVVAVLMQRDAGSDGSPDLNLIEPIWFKLKKRVQDIPGAYKSLDPLWEAAKVAWEEMPDEVVRRETSKMGARVREVLKVHGRQTRF